MRDLRGGLPAAAGDRADRAHLGPTGTDGAAARCHPAPGPSQRVGGISDKVLSQALTRLTSHGLIARTSVPADQRGVSYELTAVGASLAAGPLAALAQWAADNGEVLEPA